MLTPKWRISFVFELSVDSSTHTTFPSCLFYASVCPSFHSSTSPLIISTYAPNPGTSHHIRPYRHSPSYVSVPFRGALHYLYFIYVGIRPAAHQTNIICYQSFLLPTDEQGNCFKRSIKIYSKTAPTCFGVIAITIIRERTV